MSDDDALLSLWYELMSGGSFAATFFGFDIVARSRETRRTITFILPPRDDQ